MFLLQVVGAILLMFGSLVVLKAISLAEADGGPAKAARPRLQVVASGGRKAKARKPATDLRRAA